MSFKDKVSYNRLFTDLRNKQNEDYVNLKELRDQMVGRRCGNGNVFTWGIANDGRLGFEDEHENIARYIDEQIQNGEYKANSK